MERSLFFLPEYLSAFPFLFPEKNNHIFVGRKEDPVDTFGFCKKMKDEGKIKKLGLSTHANAEFLDNILKEHPEMEFVQLQINYLDWENPGVESRKCYEVARKHHKPIIIMEPVKGGTLAQLPEEAEAIFRALRPDDTPAQWALRFVQSLPGV